MFYKKLLVGLSVLTMCISLSACSNGDNDKDTTTKTDNSVVDESKTEENDSQSEEDDNKGEEPQAEEHSQQQMPSIEIKEIEMNDEYLTKLLSISEAPKAAIKGDVKADDFVGKYELDTIIKGDLSYNGMFGIPLYATDRVEFTKDGKGTITFIDTEEGHEANEKLFDWVFEEGKVIAQIPADIPKEAGIPEDKIPRIPTVFLLTEDGQLMTQKESIAFYNKVDDFTVFDWESIDFDYDSLA